jgi:hypothetical protein
MFSQLKGDKLENWFDIPYCHYSVEFNPIQILFIYMLTQQSNGELQNQHEHTSIQTKKKKYRQTNKNHKNKNERKKLTIKNLTIKIVHLLKHLSK